MLKHLLFISCAFFIGGTYSVAHPKDTSWSWSCDSNRYQGFYCYEAVHEGFSGLNQPNFINVKHIGDGYAQSFGACDDCVGEFRGNYVILVEKNHQCLEGETRRFAKD